VQPKPVVEDRPQLWPDTLVRLRGILSPVVIKELVEWKATRPDFPSDEDLLAKVSKMRPGDSMGARNAREFVERLLEMQ
jgi:hypothetical protein